MTTDVPKNLSQDPSINPVHDIVDVQTTDCCIVGGRQAGAVLALLLARQGISVMLLETHLARPSSKVDRLRCFSISRQD